MRAITFAVILIASPGTYAGEEWDFAAPHKDRCSDGGMQQMNVCLAAEYGKVDVRLNEAYLKLVKALEDPTKLRKAQATWIRFRDLTCEYANSGLGEEGSLYPFALNACRIDLSEKRILDLQQYLDWNCNGCPPRKLP